MEKVQWQRWARRLISEVLVGVMLGIPLWVSAQSRYVDNSLSIFVGGGIAHYKGDLAGDLNWKRLRLGPAFSAGATYQLTERFSARAEARFYRLTGYQSDTRNFENNLSFRTGNPDVYAAADLALLRASDQPAWNPSLFIGLGLTYLSPKAEYEGRWVSLPPLRTENVAYNRIPVIVPLGIALTHRLSDRYSLRLEISYTYAFSDYLDDVSTVYPPTDAMSPLARALSDRRPELGLAPNQPGFRRGNPANKDNYIIAQLKLQRRLSIVSRRYRRSLRCPTIR